MTSTKKIIKRFAIALAVALIVGIVSTAASLLYNAAQALGVIKSEINETLQEVGEIGEFNKLDMELASVNLEIKIGETFKAESNFENLKVSCKNGILTVKERSGLLKSNVEKILILYIPAGVTLENVSIEAGAGNISVERLSTKEFSLDLGAGNFEADYLEVIKEANIDGGIGNITVSDGAINDLEIDLGIGETMLMLDLTGQSDIDTGIGELVIELKREKTEYSITLDKGIGSVTYDGVSISDGSKIGDGANKLDIDGGIGSITITFNP